MKKELPKRIEKALKDRTKYLNKAREAGYVIDDYARKIGLDEFHPLYEDACLCSDIRIFCEEGHCESNTREALQKVIAERSKA